MSNNYYGACEKCKQPVTDQSGPPAFPVKGWEVLREQGGANAIKLRERIPNRVRHAHCLPQGNVNEDQETLL